MKKIAEIIGFFVLVVLMSIAFGSCSSDEYQSRLKELLPLKYPKPFSYEGGQQTTTYRNEDLSNYIAMSSEYWCKVTIDVEASEIMVSVDENDTYDERSATITMLDVKDNNVSRSFTVTQEQNPAILVEGSSYEAKSDGETVYINIKHNVDFSVSCDKDWITLTKASTRALTDTKVKVEVARNQSGAPRQAIVRVEGTGDDDISAKYIIKQSFTSDFKVEFSGTAVFDSTYVVSEKAGKVSVIVRSNYADPYYELYMDPDAAWLTKSGGPKELTSVQMIQSFEVTEFTAKEPYRLAEVYFCPPGGSKSDQVRVKIKQIRNLYLEDTAISLMAGNQSALKVYNPDNIDVVWTSSNEKVATVDASGVVTGLSEGSAIITVKSADGKYYDAASVTVSKPANLYDQLENTWKADYDPIDNIEVLTSLTSTLYNNSIYPIQLSRITLYCDGAPLKYVKFNANDKAGQINAGSYHSEKFNIEIEYEPDSDTKARQAEANFDFVATGKALPNTHSYKVSWDYSYNGESFTYNTDAYTDAIMARTR